MLTIEPEGGICNRLHALNCAIALSQTIGQPLRLIWIVNNDLRCNLTDFLKMPVEIDRMISFNKRDWSLRRKLRYNLQRYARFDYLRPDFERDQIRAMVRKDFDFESLAKRRNTHIKCGWSFYRNDQPFYPFQPIADVQRRIDKITSQFANTIGVHIRRTDHLPATEFSPTSLFVERMKTLLSEDPTTTFFVASDVPEVTAEICALFEERIITQSDLHCGRSSAQAIKDATVDLYCLAATRMVLGSYLSSFSATAGRLGNIPVEYALSEPDPDVRW